jgi:phage nucleotide-binding protein
VATATKEKPKQEPKENDGIRDLLGVAPPAESITWINDLIYGNPGAGKTYFIGTAADIEATSPVLLIDVEGGVMTLRHRQDVDVVQVRTMKQLEDVVIALQKQGDDLYYKTVGLDSLTELQKLDMRTVMKEQFNKRPDSTDIYVPSQREWGKSGERVRMIVRALRDLPCNTIMTALETKDTDERTNRTLIHPSLPGKLKTEIPGFFDIVGHLKATNQGGEVTRTLQTLGTENLIAKDRSGSLPPLMENPSVPSMWELIHSDSKSNS